MVRGLLVIDVQRGLADLDEGGGHAVLDNIGVLLKNARRARAPVFFIQHNGGDGDVLERGTPGWELHPAVQPLAGEPVVEKQWSDSFAGTDLESRLRAAGIDTVVVSGAHTEYCVDTTVRRAASLGFDVILASDAHTAYGDGALSREQIVAHHNETLPNLSLVDRTIAVAPSRAIEFAPAAP